MAELFPASPFSIYLLPSRFKKIPILIYLFSDRRGASPFLIHLFPNLFTKIRLSIYLFTNFFRASPFSIYLLPSPFPKIPFSIHLFSDRRGASPDSIHVYWKKFEKLAVCYNFRWKNCTGLLEAKGVLIFPIIAAHLITLGAGYETVRVVRQRQFAGFGEAGRLLSH